MEITRHLLSCIVVLFVINVTKSTLVEVFENSETLVENHDGTRRNDQHEGQRQFSEFPSDRSSTITKKGPQNRQYSLTFSPSFRGKKLHPIGSSSNRNFNDDFFKGRHDVNSHILKSESSQGGITPKNVRKLKRKNKSKKKNEGKINRSERRRFLDDLPSTSWWRKEPHPSTVVEETEHTYYLPPVRTLPAPQRLKKPKRPNIILIMTDDLDVELGSLNYMPKLLKTFGNGGAMFSNSFTSTPMCCPSRSSMLTGMYIHNHHVYTNHQNCSSPVWQDTHERRSFASYLSNAGYKTGYFGKYLNRYDGVHVPPGWQDWGGLLMNSRYYNYTVNRNNVYVKYGNRYPQDYYPHVITKDGLNFLDSSTKEDPFLLVLSYPSPHGPEDSAPEHAHKYFNASDHHTAAYNYAPNPDKQWVLQFTDRMPEIQLKFTDLLMTKRLQTLQTVDSAIETIVNEVKSRDLLDNTYLFFTSDHGYHLGQYGLTKGKAMPFEFDIKVPFLVRGPGIKANVELPQIALNVDLAPTFLDIAGLPRPPHMDGRSLLPILQSSTSPEELKNVAWRDSFLVESSGRVREEVVLEKKEQRTWERERAMTMTLLKASTYNSNLSNDSNQNVNLYTSKHEKLEEVCKRPEFGLPCAYDQKWHCVRIKKRWKIKKCRQKSAMWQKHCVCKYQEGLGTFTKLEAKERKKQKNFLKKYGSQDFHRFGSKFVKAFTNLEVPLHTTRNRASRRDRKMSSRRFGRSVASDEVQNESLLDDLILTGDSVQSFVEEEELSDLKEQILELTEELENLLKVKGNDSSFVRNLESWITNDDCRNSSQDLECEDSYTDPLDVEDQIRRLKQQITAMENILAFFGEELTDFDSISELDYDEDYIFGSSEEENRFNYTNFEDKLEGLVPPNVSFNMTDLFNNLNASMSRRKQEESLLREQNLGSRQENDSFDKDATELENYSKHLYPIKVADLDERLNNKNGFKICYCTEKILRKIEIRKARERRRRERLEIKHVRRKTKKRRHKKKEKSLSCNYPKLNCYTHNNEHWKTPPLWTAGNFCFCINSANNTYWCLRTINETHNFLYCEFITGLITYYDHHIDPYQLRNVAFTLSTDKVLDLHQKLTRLRSCVGADECDGLVNNKLKNSPIQENNSDGKLDSGNPLTTFVVAPDDDHDYLLSSNFNHVTNRISRNRIKKEKRRRKLLKDPWSSFSSNVRFPRRSRHNRKMKNNRRKERKLQRNRRKNKVKQA